MLSKNENCISRRNGLTLDELAQIEEEAHKSTTQEGETILRLAAALREAMQMSANATAMARGFEKKRNG